MFGGVGEEGGEASGNDEQALDEVGENLLNRGGVSLLGEFPGFSGVNGLIEALDLLPEMI